MKHHRLAEILVAASLLASSPALAGGFLVTRFGHESGHPTADNPTVAYYNPAALTLGKGTRIYVEGIFAYRTMDYTRDPDAISNIIPDGENGSGTPAGDEAANSGEAHLSDILASPFIGIASDLGVEGLGVAAAFYVPFGGQAEWDKNEAFADDARYPGAYDGPARWASIEGSQRVAYVTAAAGFEALKDKLSFGVGANLVISTIDLIRARNVNGTDDLVTISPTGETVVEGRSLLDAKSTTFAASAGVLYTPNQQWRVGLSYQSQPGFGEMEMSGTLTNKFGAAETQAGDIKFYQTLPDIIRLGVQYNPTADAEIHVVGDFQRWSVFKNHCLLDGTNPDAKCAFREDGSEDGENGGEGVIVNIPRNYNNSFGVRVGGSYWITPCVQLQGGVVYDANAVPDETIDPALMDADKVIVDVGADIGIIGELRMVAGLSHVAYFDRTTDPRDPDDIASPPSLNPDMAGTYSTSLTYATLALAYSF
jgi:long-chain fatty acid transport protein